jgi:hypothetical protein
MLPPFVFGQRSRHASARLGVDVLSADHAPGTSRTIDCATGQYCPAWVERQCLDGPGVTGEWTGDLEQRTRLPQPHHPVLVAGGKHPRTSLPKAVARGHRRSSGQQMCPRGCAYPIRCQIACGPARPHLDPSGTSDNTIGIDLFDRAVTGGGSRIGSCSSTSSPPWSTGPGTSGSPHLDARTPRSAAAWPNGPCCRVRLP